MDTYNGAQYLVRFYILITYLHLCSTVPLILRKFETKRTHPTRTTEYLRGVGRGDGITQFTALYTV